MAETMTLPAPLKRNDWSISRLITALKCLSVLKDEAANPELAWKLHVAMDDRRYEALGVELAKSNPKLFEERRTVPTPELTLEKLAEYPEGTLAKVFSGYFQKNGIFPFTYEYPVQSNADVLYKRYRETHDIHHMLTGYGIDDFGEIEIQAFYIANLGLRHARLIVFFGVPYLIVQQRSFSKVINRLVAAYRRGKKARNMLTLPYEDMWGVPVKELTETYCPV
ncbi:MAG: Coq4 family protein [Archangium sp.]